MFIWINSNMSTVVRLNGQRYNDVSMALIIKLAADRSVK